MPSGAAYVVDYSFLETVGVREDYELYGSCAFFDSERNIVGIWSCHTQVAPHTLSFIPLLQWNYNIPLK